jgi:hypothetical protein
VQLHKDRLSAVVLIDPVCFSMCVCGLLLLAASADQPSLVGAAPASLALHLHSSHQQTSQANPAAAALPNHADHMTAVLRLPVQCVALALVPTAAGAARRFMPHLLHSFLYRAPRFKHLRYLWRDLIL